MNRQHDTIATMSRHISTGIAAVAVVFAGLLVPVFAFADEQTLGSTVTSDKVRVDVLSLKRTEGDTVTLRLQITNNGHDTFSMTLGNARLVDLVGRRIYSPGITSPTCFAPAGEKLTCYAVFGAPPAATQKVSVQFYEKVDLISGVPVSD